MDTTHTNSKGKVFHLVGPEPHTRKDGKRTTLLRWRTICDKEGCGAAFDIRTPTSTWSSKSFERKHCDAHKLTWAEVCTLGRQHQQARKATKKRKVSDAEVAEMRQLAQEGLTPDDLAVVFPLAASTIREIVAGRKRPPATH